jgi:hypothetical protein
VPGWQPAFHLHRASQPSRGCSAVDVEDHRTGDDWPGLVMWRLNRGRGRQLFRGCARRHLMPLRSWLVTGNERRGHGHPGLPASQRPRPATADLGCWRTLAPYSPCWLSLAASISTVSTMWIAALTWAWRGRQVRHCALAPASQARSRYFRSCILERWTPAQDVFSLGNQLVWITPSGAALVLDKDGKTKARGC